MTRLERLLPRVPRLRHLVLERDALAAHCARLERECDESLERGRALRRELERSAQETRARRRVWRRAGPGEDARRLGPPRPRR